MTAFVFMCEAGAEAGVGHLFRCMALAQAARDQGVDSHFLVTGEGADIAKAQFDWDFPIVEYCEGKSNAEIRANIEPALTTLLSRLGTAVLVVDGYSLPFDLVEQAKPLVSCIVAMDDGDKRFVNLADIVVNPAATHDSYHDKSPTAHLCVGGEYRLLRRDFLSLSPRPVYARHGLVICFGGSDPAQLTIPLLKCLDTLGFDTPVRVITGTANPYHEQVSSLCRTLNYPVQHIHNCQDMAQVWSSAKLAVSAAGGSQFELGVCQTPSILVTVADNQKAASLLAVNEGWCDVVDKSLGAEVIAARIANLCTDEEKLARMQQNAEGRYDALGATRILQVIAEVIRD
ncbi:hypothetical protein KUL49_20330 [Alteromonas sp. KUL49]|nr:hypothetical protein KUL49_20330 [Alteromonas sp. KUL49]